MPDPIRQLEHSHANLTKVALEIRALVRAEPLRDRSWARNRRRLLERLTLLRDELLRHFAVEEEGLFPFLRVKVPARAAAVDRLAEAHDAICGAIVRLTDLAERHRTALGPLLAHYERFERAYTEHSQQEAALFDELERTLDESARTELSEILRGL